MNQAVMAAMGNRDMIDASNEGRKGVLKAASKVQDSEIAGVRVPPEAAKPMARNSRTSAEVDTTTDAYEVMRVDTDVSDGFRVRLRNVNGGEIFFASVRDRLVSENDRKLIQRGEWEKKAIVARIRITRRRGEVAAARVDEVLNVVGEEQIASSE